MGVNFPLILVLGTAFTGAVWLFEVIFLRKRREVAVARLVDTAGGAAPEVLDDARREPVLVEYSISFFPVLAIVLVLRSFLYEPFQIPTGSMIPTLNVGDFILVNKYAYGIRLPVIGTKVYDVDEPKNGEVMVFIPPHEDEYFIKRIVGVPGDRVRYANETLYINGVEQPQEFVGQVPPVRPRYVIYRETLGGIEHLIHRVPRARASAEAEWVVPPGQYFMMGDNRDRSKDSRAWGFVSEENIVGKAVAVWLHKDPGLKLPVISQNRWIE